MNINSGCLLSFQHGWQKWILGSISLILLKRPTKSEIFQRYLIPSSILHQVNSISKLQSFIFVWDYQQCTEALTRARPLFVLCRGGISAVKDKVNISITHSKNSRVRFDPKKSPRGPDPFWGQTYPESRSDWPGIRVRKTRNPSQKDILDSDSGNFYPASRSVWPRNGSGPMGPFSGSNLTRKFFRVQYQHRERTQWA